MIIKWAPDGTGAFTAAWQGIAFRLYKDAPPAPERWRLKADGKKIKESWSTSRRAMEFIDTRQTALLQQALTGPQGGSDARS